MNAEGERLNLMNRAKEMFSYVMQPISSRRGHFLIKEVEGDRSLERYAI